MVKNILAGLLAGGVLCLIRGADPTADQRERIERIENSLLAPCCYAEAVSRHNSEVAIKMRLEIATWVKEGKSDREILNTYKKLYGLRVLREPEGSTWWWSNLVPWFVLAMSAFLTVRIVRKWRRPHPPTPAIAAEKTMSIPDFDDQW
jgi:cytochrome c-type biogenesis protein CcmH/NrfF